MKTPEFLENVGRRIAASQGFSQALTITPFYDVRQGTRFWNINQAGSSNYYDFNNGVWSAAFPSFARFFYGIITVSSYTISLPTNNYTIGLNIVSPLINGSGFQAINRVTRGSLINPFISKITVADIADGINYTSPQNEILLAPQLMVSTDGAGTLNMNLAVQFQGWMVSFN